MKLSRLARVILPTVMVATVWLLLGCEHGNYVAEQRVVTSVNPSGLIPLDPTPSDRLRVSKREMDASGNPVKRWEWDEPWYIRNDGRDVIRELRHPDYLTKGDLRGPILTLVQDPQRGTIYNLVFVQRTWKVFSMPISIDFLDEAGSTQRLFVLDGFTDVTTPRCRNQRVDIGSIKVPMISQSLFDVAVWARPTTGGFHYGNC